MILIKSFEIFMAISLKLKVKFPCGDCAICFKQQNFGPLRSTIECTFNEKEVIESEPAGGIEREVLNI